jgi:hypothetical protein
VSVCLSARNNTRTAKQVPTKYDKEEFYSISLPHRSFLYNWAETRATLLENLHVFLNRCR